MYNPNDRRALISQAAPANSAVYPLPMASYAMPQMAAPIQIRRVAEELRAIAPTTHVFSVGREKVVRKESSKKTARPNGDMYHSIAVAMIGATMFGLDLGNFDNVQTFDDFVAEWCVGLYGTNLTCQQYQMKAVPNREWETFIAWGATLTIFGAAAGAIVLGPVLANKLGRRPCIMASGAICFIGCLMASYLSFNSVHVFFTGRFIIGFGVGVSCFALPLYNSEVSTPNLRGTTGSLFQLNVVVGCFIACLITLFVRDWKFGILMPGLAGAFLMVNAPCIPESPRFVMKKRGFDAAVEVLERVRSGDVLVEANEMFHAIEEEQGVDRVGFVGLCQNANLRKRVIISCGLAACQQATGVNALLGYAGKIFDLVGIEDPVLFDTIFNSIMIFGCIAGLLAVDSRYGGRKCQLLWASAIMGTPLILSGLALQLEWSGTIVVACVCVYGVGFQFAWGSIPWIYPAEIFSMSEKDYAVALAVFVNYVNNAVVVMITPALMSWSAPGTMYFFGIANAFCALFVWSFIEETKGVPLEDVPALFRVDDASESEDAEY
eukprot:TRINITY_DN64724_c0_g1_i1.p1 TRINITY_DN64724_c0_g1~~TRINITY_DN64724_c0_g1_i1.p1  ORF type:complete len:549 (+),score=77.50 TRINITY_DN64724_c0_g1_i1:64-1710(+)